MFDALDRSRLLYLTDALTTAPAKAAIILDFARDTSSSSYFLKEVAVFTDVMHDLPALNAAVLALKERLT